MDGWWGKFKGRCIFVCIGTDTGDSNGVDGVMFLYKAFLMGWLHGWRVCHRLLFC